MSKKILTIKRSKMLYILNSVINIEYQYKEYRWIFYTEQNKLHLEQRLRTHTMSGCSISGISALLSKNIREIDQELKQIAD